MAEATRVAAALQKQVLRDLAPRWRVSACVSAFASLREVPPDSWTILVTEGLPESGAAGMHHDRLGRPFCLVEFGTSWTLAASHECLEMLVDPTGNRLIYGPSPMPEQGEVGYLIQVCDACGDAQFAYTLDGVLLSDFCTPQFFASAGARSPLSHTGAVEKPLQVLKNGYLTWFDTASRAWYQQQHVGSAPKVTRLGLPGAEFRCMREFTNQSEADHRRLSHYSTSVAATELARRRMRQHGLAAEDAAELLLAEISELGRRLRIQTPRRHRASLS